MFAPRISDVFVVVFSDKNLNVSISGDVDEAKALSKPPDDSQGTNFTALLIKFKMLDCVR